MDLTRRGDPLRATARLLGAAEGSAAGSGSFDERFTGLFELQDPISHRVLGASAPKLQSSPPVAGRATAPRVGISGTRLIFLRDDLRWVDLRRQPRFMALMLTLELDRFGPGLAPIRAGAAPPLARGLSVSADSGRPAFKPLSENFQAPPRTCVIR